LGIGLFLGERSAFGMTYFWKERPNFLARATSGKKATCKKEGKAACRRKRKVACRKTSLTMIGLGFLTNILKAISL
jgi:hypothetical protein